MCLKLKQKAILIADAHYPNHQKEAFLELLEGIKSQKISTPQLILMGDIFDLLVGNSPYLKDRFSYEIDLINSIAKDIEVIYLEGNHDFFLKPLFKSIRIIPINMQPLTLEFNKKNISLSHGDTSLATIKYKIYTKIIRNPWFLKVIPDRFAKYKLKKMKSKKICREIKDFNLIVKEIKKRYRSDFIVEGHYHQGVVINHYYALPSFACTKEVAVVEEKEIVYKKLENIF